VESAVGYVFCPSPGGTGASLNEQFAVFSANLVAGLPLGPGSSVLLKSAYTGRFCRVAFTAARPQLTCDVEPPSAAGAATPLALTAAGGLSYSGMVRSAAPPA
jgi:hypothetical protein